ncbi:MAG: HAMP domain-containing histidine kinase [Chloroflexi bacterium]|nr:MAG: HAMP domain-containing histidine kinase [Chloroflexota bacterium]
MEATQDRLLDLSLRLFRPDWPRPVRYGLAVLFTLAIAGLKLAIPAFGAPGPDLFLTIPVAASAVLAGFGPALLATIGTTLVAAYFTPPAGFAISLNTNGLDVIGFFFEGLVVAILGAVVRAAFGRTAESLRRREQLEQERSALIATVNHEIRNPLASLSGYLQLASRYSRREDMRERVSPAIDEAERQVGRLVRLADDLQVISSPSAVFRMELEPFDLALAAHAAARRVEALDPAREVTVSAPSVPLMARADPARLDQILDNLLKNAVAYSPRVTPIEISASAEADHALIRVRDHGAGIDPADRERIFERFARGATAASQPGMGIGLYVSRAIAMRMGGRLFIEESSSQGTVFAVEIPLAVAEADLAPDLETSPTNATV